MNTYHIKLINGEELISRIDKKTLEQEEILLINPMIVEIMNDDEGSKTVLSNYIKFVSDPKCKISRTKIITFVQVPKEVETYYQNSKMFADQHDDIFLREIVDANKKMHQYRQNLLNPVEDDLDAMIDLPMNNKTLH